MEHLEHHKQTSANPQSRQWVQLIRKLRWIGMEDEAHRLQMAVCGLPPHERPAVLTGPFNTD